MMANHNYGRNRNRSGFHQDWDNGDNINFPTTNIDNRRARNRPIGRDYGNIYSSNRDRVENNDSNNRNDRDQYRGNDDRFDNDREQYDQNQRYSNQDGQRDDYRRNEGQQNQGYMGSGYNYGRYENRRDQNFNEQYRHDDEDRGWWDRTRDEVSSWFGDDDAQRRRREDERQGEHRGKGPKGYTRSDDRIKDDVNDKLSDDTFIDASEIEVAVSNGEVTISGTVNTRWEKRHAEDLIESLSGVKNVENRLRVGSPATGNTTAGAPQNLEAKQEDNFKQKKSNPLSNYESSKS